MLISPLNSEFSPSSSSKAEVIPLYKTGSRLNVKKYRPKTLSEVWCEVFERSMFNREYEFFESLDLLFNIQFGSRKKYSNIDTLVNFTDKIRRKNHSESFEVFFLIPTKYSIQSITPSY